MAEDCFISRNQVEAALAVLAQAGNRLIAAQPDVSWRLKSDGTFLTALDGEIQQTLKGPLLDIFPGCVFVAEEDTSALTVARERKPRLILDPIDGTAAFARGFNFFSISLAVLNSNGEPRVGIVYLPSRGKWYAGAQEAAGWVSYHVSVAGGNVKATSLRTTVAQRPSWKMEDTYVYVSSNAHREIEMSSFEGKLRALGASASHLALLLDRTLDPGAVILTNYKLWDVVAGLPLAQSAGFEIRDLRRPKEAFVFRDFVNDLLNSRKPLPLLVGASDVVRALMRTIRYRGELV